jgi:glycosyltransferase involved in cell wall biosynthesis
MDRASLLLVYTHYSSFVKADNQILSRHFTVRQYQFRSSKNPFRLGIEYVRFFCFLLFRINKFSIIHCWFADYHAFLPALFAKVFKKKFLLAIGGYDAIYFPELKYGAYSNAFRSFCAGFAIRNASCNLCVSDSILNNLKKRFGNDFTGMVVPTACDPLIFRRTDAARKEGVITIALTKNYQTMRIKGLDRFAELAFQLPEIPFTIIGMAPEARILLGKIPGNLQILDALPHEALIEYYNRAAVYAQLSMDEGLPNAVCEAMLCECIPVGMRAGGIPMAMGDNGFLLDSWNAAVAAHLVEKALMAARDGAGAKARQYIMEQFTFARRESSLLNIINQSSSCVESEA